MADTVCIVPARTRRGYTVAELIVVLVLIAGALAMTLPSILAPYNKAELQDAAKQVRTGLSQARVAAITSGVPHEFRYQPGGRRFMVAPRASFSDGLALQGADVPASESAAAAVAWGEAPAETAFPTESLAEELPQGVVFAIPAGEEAASPQFDSPPATDETSPAADSWSAPIVFYPNGCTSNERIRLFGQDDFSVDLLLRGLTGTTTIGELVRPEEALAQTDPLAPDYGPSGK
jgi:type II secretory pathway pseudopilin PulG